MAEIQDPSYLQGGSHTAQGDRAVLQTLIPTEGVVDKAGGDLLVTEQGTPAMGVTVAAGKAVIQGDESGTQGVYHVENDAAKDLAIAAADATNARIDLVVARVYDSFYSGATDSWALEVVTGTAAATPSEPTVPDNAHVLARVDVAASASSITNANITDRREQARMTPQLSPLSAAEQGFIATAENTSSSSFTDLATVGPQVTLVTGTMALVLFGALMGNDTAGATSRCAPAVTGATSRPATFDETVDFAAPSGGDRGRYSGYVLMDDLTPGENTFTLRYATTGSSVGEFIRRTLTVIPIL